MPVPLDLVFLSITQNLWLHHIIFPISAWKQERSEWICHAYLPGAERTSKLVSWSASSSMDWDRRMSLYMPGIIRVTLELGRGWCLEHLNGQMDIRNWSGIVNDDRVWVIFNWVSRVSGIALFLLHFVVWLAQRTRATFWSNQIQN